MPPPPIPDHLRDRGKVLYGCKITDADIARYLEVENIRNVPTDAESRQHFKFALIRSVADELDMGFITEYHMALPWKPKHGPVDDMAYWAYGSYGRSIHSKVPSSDVVRVFMSKLHIHHAEPAWHSD